jgi:transcription elongation factor GreB
VSKAFTKEDGADAPVVVPPRAALPAGVPNYVTPRGLGLLRTELADLEAQRARLAAPNDDVDRRHRLAVLDRRLADLGARLASAQVVDPRGQPHDEVRFGATVTLRTLAGERPGEERRYTIVGVDEADPAQGRVAFVAPLARAILGCRRGDTASLRTARGEEELEVTEVRYDP